MIRGNLILRWPVPLVAILCAGLLSQWMHGEGSAAIPSVNVGGVVNNASYTLASPNVAPGTIAAVFGSNLTDGTSCLPAAGCFPSFDTAGRLRTTMSGAQVTVNGIAVPIFYATPTQLGIQIPTDVPGTSGSIRVTVGSQTSVSRTILIDPFSPGLFTVSQDGSGAGAIAHADGSLVDTSNPALPEEVVIIYATGLGQVTPALPTGTLPRGTTRTLATPTVTIDGIPAQVLFSGLSGCCVGLNQINVVVPVNVHLASNIPVVLSIGGRQSNIVTLATAATTPLTAAPGSINFGSVPLGTSRTQTVTLSNTGIVSLTVSQANVLGPGFTVSGLSLPLTLEPGQSASFSVGFLPTAPGRATGSLSITSDALNSLVSLSGNAPSRPTIPTTSLPDGRQSTPYNKTLVATGGETPYSWSITAGSLPAGLTLGASTGVISGTPTSTGTSSFTVQVTDAISQTATTALSITINPPDAPFVTTTSLPDGTQNKPYSASVEATGGTTPYSWSVTAGSLPAGLTLGASTGVISGTTTGNGTSNFTVKVTAANSKTATAPLSITVIPETPLSITTTSLPDGTQNKPYSASVEATGGTTPYSWSVTAGSLPAGLTLGASTGVISGTPTASGTSGFTVQVTDANSKTANAPLSIVVVPETPLSITTTSLPDGRQNTPYNATMVATAGQTPYSWSVIAGALPTGLTLGASTGVISGTPTATGTSSFSVRVTDANSKTATAPLSITINAPNAPLVTTTSLPDGTQNKPYSASVGATGGTTPYSWSISAGSLPAGLTLAASTGLISGTPTTPGTSNFTVQVTDANSQASTAPLSITVVPDTPLSITTNTLPDGRQSAPYNATLVATGGQTPYTWLISAGSLPAGLTLGAGTAVISGTPTASGTSNFTVRVTDANSQTATTALSITVYLPLSITTNSLPNGAVTVAYNQTLAATGGKIPYSWSVIAGTLPTGLTLAASTGVISGVPTAGGTFNFTVRVTETNSETATKALSITIATSTSGVSLTWTASSTPSVTYNAYRATVSGGPYLRLNSTPITTTTYTDTTVLGGQTYFYVVTAVNSSGVESLFSNEATVP